MDASEIVGKFGSVIVDVVDEKQIPNKVVFNFIPLTAADELALNAELKALVDSDRKAKRDGILSELGAVKNPTWAHQKFVIELATQSMQAVDMYDVNAKRFELEGVQTELWYRAKKVNPNLRREEVKACVTVQNMLDVRSQIDAAITLQKESGLTPTKSEAV